MKLKKDIGEFVRFCQQNNADDTLPETVQEAVGFADFCEDLERAYGGHRQTFGDFIQLAFERAYQRPSHKDLKKFGSVLTRLWAHGDAFEVWHRSITPLEYE